MTQPDLGFCTPGAEQRHRAAPPCDEWFGLAQLVAATAPRRRAA